MYAVAALVDLDDFVATERARGRSWARAQLDRVERTVRATAGSRASSRPMPPDEWLLLLTGADPGLLAAEAVVLAEELRGWIGRESDLTATVSLGSPCRTPAAAEAEARRTNAYKLVLGGDRVITAAQPQVSGPPVQVSGPPVWMGGPPVQVGGAPDRVGGPPVRVGGAQVRVSGAQVRVGGPPVRIEGALARKVRAGDRVGAADLISGWLDRCARTPGADPYNLRNWLIGQLLFVVDVASTARLADGSTDWVDACARLPIDDLIAVADIHERSYLRIWLQDALQRLVPATPSRDVLTLAETYLAEHFTNPRLRLATVAEAISASPFYISHLFAEERGTTFLRHLTGLRLRHARHLLNSSTLPVDAVAARSGYLSAKALRGVFKRHVGCTPKEYRRHG